MTFSERERYIFHLAVLELMKESDEMPEIMFREVLGRVVKERCRHLSVEEQQEIVDEMGEEFIASKNVLDFIEDDIKRMGTGK